MKIDLEKLKKLAKEASKGERRITITEYYDPKVMTEYIAATPPATILKLIELIEVYRYALIVHSHHGELVDSEAYKATVKGLRILGEL